MNNTFKQKERELQHLLEEGQIVGMRMDGRSFSTFTKQFKAPYDEGFMDTMDKTAMFVMDNIFQSAMFAYVQSDEITIFFREGKSGYVFGGRMEKILSTSASAATGGFMKTMPDAQGVPVFDARMFYLSDMEGVEEYLDWRRMDARKNAITMSAGCIASHKELMKKSTAERWELLQGTEYELLPNGFLYGRMIVKESVQEEVTFVDKRDMTEKTILADRKHWFSYPAVREKATEVARSFYM